MEMIKRLVILGGIIAWTLAVIYGTYSNTVRHAIPVATESGYEITFANTGETYTYK